MMRILIVSLLVCAAVMTACAPSPTELAEAEAMRVASVATATAAAQQAELQAALNKVAIQQAEQTAQARVSATNSALYALMIAGFVVIVVLLLALAYFAARAAHTTALAYQVYAVERARLAANLISVDPRTRMLPALKADNLLANPNTDSALMLDAPHEANPAVVEAYSAVARCGLAAEAITEAYRQAQGDVAQGLGNALILPPAGVPRGFIQADNGLWVPPPAKADGKGWQE